MNGVFKWIETAPAYVPWLVLAGALLVLSKGADLFVESAVALARGLKVPRLIIGIVLVSFATTSPELSVSLFSAIQGRPEMALGNAVGSVICNVGVALALCGALSPRPVPVIPRVLRRTGGFLAFVAVLSFALVVNDGVLGRGEGALLFACFAGYLALSYREHKRGEFSEQAASEAAGGDGGAVMGIGRALGVFMVAIAVVIVASRFTVASAVVIAVTLRIPESVIALTLVALGTSVPEVATSIKAARKGHGELSVGNILGANIMNICWVAGASSMANPLALPRRELFFMFPAMLITLAATFWVLRTHRSLSRQEGVALFVLYLVYLASFIVLFPPGTS